MAQQMPGPMPDQQMLMEIPQFTIKVKDGLFIGDEFSA